MNNKYFSNRQEQMIADYLGWRQITGSGSRPGAPGDVNSSQWLGECKTHDTEKKTIVFLKSHWFKICNEARAKNRYPVLFKDNGTQRSDSTWVMTVLSVFDPATVHIIEGLKNTSTKGNSLTFDLGETQSTYKSNAVADKYNVFTLRWEDRNLAVMPLSTFRDFIKDSF